MKNKWFIYNSTFINLDEIVLLNFEEDKAVFIFKNCDKKIDLNLKDVKDFSTAITKSLMED